MADNKNYVRGGGGSVLIVIPKYGTSAGILFFVQGPLKGVTLDMEGRYTVVDMDL